MLYRLRVLLEYFSDETGNVINVLKSKTFDISNSQEKDLTRKIRANFRKQPEPNGISYIKTEENVCLDFKFIVISKNDDFDNLVEFYKQETNKIFKEIDNLFTTKGIYKVSIGNLDEESMLLSIRKHGISHFDENEYSKIIQYLKDNHIQYKEVYSDEFEYHGGAEGGFAELLIVIQVTVETILTINGLHDVIEKLWGITINKIEPKKSKDYLVKKYVANEYNIYIDNLVVSSKNYNSEDKETTYILKDRNRTFIVIIDDKNRIIQLNIKETY